MNDVLDISKIEAGKVTIDKSDFPLENFLSIKYNILPLIADKNVEFNIYFDPKMPHTIYSDESKIIQVLTNLAGNSAKFTTEGFINIDFKYLEKGKMMLVSVSDSGTGIKPEYLENVFEEFYQIAGEKQTIKGSGLGLPICKRIVHMLGGDIWVESVFGEGSTFSFKIDIEQPIEMIVQSDPNKDDVLPKLKYKMSDVPSRATKKTRSSKSVTSSENKY